MPTAKPTAALQSTSNGKSALHALLGWRGEVRHASCSPWRSAVLKISSSECFTLTSSIITVTTLCAHSSALFGKMGAKEKNRLIEEVAGLPATRCFRVSLGAQHGSAQYWTTPRLPAILLICKNSQSYPQIPRITTITSPRQGPTISDIWKEMPKCFLLKPD